MFLKTVIQRSYSRLFYDKYSSKKRHRTPSSFQECMETPERSRNARKPLIFVLLILLTFYYMFYHGTYDPNPDVEPFVESALPNEQIESTNSVTGDIMIIYKKHEENDSMNNMPEAKTKRPTRLFFVPRENLPMCASVTVTGVKNDSNTSMPTFPKTVSSIDQQKAMDMGIMMGGHYVPKGCNPRHRVAILVPYRNRRSNLDVFLYFMHPFLIRQQLEYRIFVIEQAGTKIFNKGRLFNAGVQEIHKNDDWQCVIFHDVDLLPADDRIRYTCPVLPRHMCAVVVGKEHITKYNTMFGGVTAMTMWHFRKTNGFSNNYQGRGESEDMFKRMQAAGLGVTRYKKDIARYFSLKHPYRGESLRKRETLLTTAAKRMRYDGLSSLHYLLVSYASKPLFTHIVVDISMKKLPNYITESAVILSP